MNSRYFQISTVFTVLFLIITLFSFSCTTTTVKENHDENFIADFPPYKLDTIVLLSGNGKKKPESSEFTYTFYPKTNIVEIDTQVSIDKYLLVLTPELRKELAAAMNEYLTLYETNNLPEQIPSKKNAISTGTTEIYWGVMTYSYTSDAAFYTNYEYVEEDKPFFILTIPASRAKDSDAYSPAARFYLTPSQIRNQIELLNQEILEADARGKEQELYLFE